ncbi:MAG: hypothetical protein KTR30_20025 [Saprospiraceae bacterium]|nr:hypothetical protein [Saprospiraceae bacterium]
MKSLVTVTTLFFLCSTLNLLRSQDSLLVATIRQHTYNLKVNEQKFSGEGATILQEAMQAQQFLLVGEQHGIVEVGAFTNALLEAARPLGFQYFCIETDPFIAKKLEQLVGEGKPALDRFVKAFPLSIPFYDNTEDYQMLSTALQGPSVHGPKFWGVDQVFAAAPRYLFQRLAEIAPDASAKAMAEDYLKQGRAGLQAVMKNGDFNQMILNKLEEKDFKLLYEAFGNDAESESTQIIQGMLKTKEIYAAWYAGKYHQNNLIRSKLMKRQFMEYYREAEKLSPHPKVVFKFGATHTYRGLSYYHIFDLGNLVAELAAMNDMESLHIHFSGIKGTANGGLQGVQSFDNQKDIAPEIWAAIADRATAKDWIMVDMRPLREKFGRRKLKPIKNEVFNYDFWIFVPEATPVSTIR